MDGSVEGNIVPVAPGVPRTRGTFASELLWKASQARGTIVGLLKCSPDVANSVELLRQLRKFASEPGKELRLVLPPDIMEALAKGDLKLKESKDGGGEFLATLTDPSGQFFKQLRVRYEDIARDPQALIQAASQLKTQALLGSVLSKLEVLDSKLDECLESQRDGWVATIVAGVKNYRIVLREPGRRESFDFTLGVAIRDLTTAKEIGLRQLKRYVRKLRAAPRLNGFLESSPSLKRGNWLDRIQEDLEFLYAASQTLSAIHTHEERPIAAADEREQFRLEIEQVVKKCFEIFRYAQVNKTRELFWGRAVPALITQRDALTEPIVLAALPGEILNLEAPCDQ